MDTILKRVCKRTAYAVYAKVQLVEPVGSGFIHLGAEVDRRLPFLPPSRTKRVLLRACRRLCKAIARCDGVTSAVVFKAALIPPGRGEFLKQHPEIHIARFDVVVLIETDSVERARGLRRDKHVLGLEARLDAAASYSRVVVASNVKRIGAVDHQRGGVFLFNYFFAADRGQNLAVWEYTAGWFQRETGLDNSTVLQPVAGEDSQYTIINHCRWNGMRDILPSLLFKRSFRDYVLVNFEANHVAAIPVLYRLG